MNENMAFTIATLGLAIIFLLGVKTCVNYELEGQKNAFENNYEQVMHNDRLVWKKIKGTNQ